MGYRKKVYKIGKAAEKGADVFGIIASILGGIATLAIMFNKSTKKK